MASFRRLNDGPYRRSLESPKPFGPGRFVAEGWLVLERALAARVPVEAILVASARLARLDDLLDGRAVDVLVADGEVIEAIVGFDLHRGVVAVCERRRLPDVESLVQRSARLLVVEGVSDTENLGALFRNAAGLGADGIVVDTTSADPWSRRVVRTSMGHVLTVPWCRSPVGAAIDAAIAAGHHIVALTPAGDVELTDLEASDRPTAVVVGAEGPGLTRDTLGRASVTVRIDMAHDVDSLNVATAAALGMRQAFGPAAARPDYS